MYSCGFKYVLNVTSGEREDAEIGFELLQTSQDSWGYDTQLAKWVFSPLLLIS